MSNTEMYTASDEFIGGFSVRLEKLREEVAAKVQSAKENSNIEKNKTKRKLLGSK